MINLIQAFKLWDDLGFYRWSMNSRRENIQWEKIKAFKKEHPICNFIAIIFC